MCEARAGERAVAVEPRCCVLDCARSAPLHPFPAEEKVRARWVGATGRRRGGVRWAPPAGAGVCARHFAPEHYSAGGTLREDAVPALYLPPQGLDAELAALSGGYSTSCLRTLALHAARRPALLQPPPPPPHPAHAAHRAALAELARALRLRDETHTQRRLDDFVHIHDRLVQWCRLRAQHELGEGARALELAPEWLRRAEVMRGGGAGGRGPAGELWRELAARARARRSLDGAELPGPVGAVWARGLELARARLELLARVGDDEEALHPGARPAFHLEDLVVLLDEEAPGAGAPEPALALLFGLVQRYRLEEGSGLWAAAARDYRSRHRAASALLLQRRWHELKLAARRAPGACALHAAVLRRYPRLRAAPPAPWRALLAAGRVHHEDPDPLAPPDLDSEPLEDVAMRFQEPADEGEADDVILVERQIDTFEISDEEEEGSPAAPSSSDGSGERTAPCAGEGGEGGEGEGAAPRAGVDVKLTMTPVVVVREVSAARGWRLRAGRYVDLRRLQPPPPPPPPRRTLAHSIVFEDDDDIDLRLVVMFSEDADCEESGEGRAPAPAPPGPPGAGAAPRKKVQLPDIEQVRIQNRNMLTAEVLPRPAGAGGARPGPGKYCCWALRARAVHAARARAALRAGRLYCPTDDAVQYHRSHCGAARCACCCAGAERGLAGAALAAEQRALDDRLLQLLPAPAPPPAPPPPASPGLAAPPSRCKRYRKRRRAESPPPPPPPPADDLQEWIRQKNLTARFFDLNLKRPAPARAPAPAPAPVFKRSNTVPENQSGCGLPPGPWPAPPPPPPPPVALGTMSVSEDEDEEEVGGGARRKLPPAAFGLKIVRIRRNPASGQRVIVVRPATADRARNTTSWRVQPRPTPTPTPTSTATPTLNLNSTGTPSLTPTSTSTPTLIPKSTATPSLTPTSTATPTLTPTSTATPTLIPKSTATSTATPSLTPTSTATPSLTPTSTATSTLIPKSTATSTATPTLTPPSTAASPPAAGSLPRLVIVARKLTDAEVRAGKVIEPAGAVKPNDKPVERTPSDRDRDPVGADEVGDREASTTTHDRDRDTPGGERGAAAAATATATATVSDSESEHSDETYNQGYIQYISSALHSGGMLTVAPVAPATSPATPVTEPPVTVAAVSVTETSVTVAAVSETETSVTAGDDTRSGRLAFQAIPSASEDLMFRDKVVGAGQVSWAGRPLVVACSRLQAPWAPLLGWYMLTEGVAPGAGPGPDPDYWVFGETMYRLASLPARSVRLVHGVPDARTCRALAERGAPLLALHMASRRVLRVAARRHGRRLLLRAAATHLAERLAEALNAAPTEADTGAPLEILDDDDDDDSRPPHAHHVVEVHSPQEN